MVGQDRALLQILVQIQIQIRTLTLRLAQTVIWARLLLNHLDEVEDENGDVAKVARLR